MSCSPSPIAASCLWPPAVVGSQKGANSPFWVQKGCIWHRKFMAAVVRPAQLCSQKGFCSITTSLTKKSKDLSPSASHVLAKALGTAFSVRVKLMFASPLMTDQYMLIDFSHQNIYFSNRTPSSQTNEGLHKKSSASVWQQTENRNIFLYSETKFLWLNRAKNISPPRLLPDMRHI